MVFKVSLYQFQLPTFENGEDLVFALISGPKITPGESVVPETNSP